MIRLGDPGPQTTVQDFGRPGHLRDGIPPSGPMDVRSFVIANRLVGNADGAAALECTVLGPRFTAQAPCAIAVTGAETTVTVNDEPVSQWASVALKAGDRVRVGAARAGVRMYVAFSGGIDVPPALGSRSTYLRGRLGGLGGRALRRDDTLTLRAAPLPSSR
ncbi:MAG TPA: hypothetical protein VFL90_19370, partial [Methylomirabilota bacterium]|nr:hypothetical protein [Methylomirabilota bacterium]